MSFKAQLGRIASRAVAGLVALAALSSCGGGTYQVNPFVPQRILTFGDESNMLVGAQGLKYSINGVSLETNLIDCSLLPLWTQVLAASYNIVYPNCNTEAVASPAGEQLATVGAQVDDLQNQIDAFLSIDGFNSNDLVTIWVGSNDVLDAYSQDGGGDSATLITDMRARGLQLANIVNNVTTSGARVVLLTIPDLGDSPFAATENERGDFDRAALLSQMSDAFNRSMRSNIINDGSKIGLVLVDDFVHTAVRSPGSYGLISTPSITAGCLSTAPLPSCSETTTVTDPESNSNAAAIFLWADPTHLASTAQNEIGNQAVSRAHTNPF